MNEYENEKVSNLREIARSRGLRGWSRLRKDDLISFIIGNENFTSDRVTEVAMRVGKKTVRELKDLARARGVRIPSRASKSEIIFLLAENYGERRRAAYEKKFGLWDSEIRADEETTRWEQEIGEEERARKPSEPVRPKLAKKAMGGNVQKWIVSGSDYLDPQLSLDDVGDGVKKLVDTFKMTKKVYMNLTCVLAKENMRTGTEELDLFGSRSGTYVVTVQLGEMYEMMSERMLENLSKFQRNGSGWRLKSISDLEIGIAKFDPLSGSGYSKLPEFIRKKKAVVNMKNDDNQCFKWAVTRALNFIDSNTERVTKELREQTKKYDWSNIEYPTKVDDIHIWEKNNNILINVFGYDEDAKTICAKKMCKGFESIVIGEEEDVSDKIINLYLHDDNHYCVIRNLSRLVSSQLSKKKIRNISVLNV